MEYIVEIFGDCLNRIGGKKKVSCVSCGIELVPDTTSPYRTICYDCYCYNKTLAPWYEGKRKLMYSPNFTAF